MVYLPTVYDLSIKASGASTGGGRRSAPTVRKTTAYERKRDVGAKRHMETSDYYTFQFTYLRVICPNLDLANRVLYRQLFPESHNP